MKLKSDAVSVATFKEGDSIKFISSQPVEMLRGQLRLEQINNIDLPIEAGARRLNYKKKSDAKYLYLYQNIKIAQDWDLFAFPEYA